MAGRGPLCWCVGALLLVGCGEAEPAPRTLEPVARARTPLADPVDSCDDCPTGTVCRDVPCGRCTPDDCDCFACSPSPPYCNRDEDCGEGRSCVGERCSCTTNFDCGEMAVCDDAVCTEQQCVDDSQCCPDAGQGPCDRACSTERFCASPLAPSPAPEMSCASGPAPRRGAGWGLFGLALAAARRRRRAHQNA